MCSLQHIPGVNNARNTFCPSDKVLIEVVAGVSQVQMTEIIYMMFKDVALWPNVPSYLVLFKSKIGQLIGGCTVYHIGNFILMLLVGGENSIVGQTDSLHLCKSTSSSGSKP